MKEERSGGSACFHLDAMDLLAAIMQCIIKGRCHLDQCSHFRRRSADVRSGSSLKPVTEEMT